MMHLLLLLLLLLLPEEGSWEVGLRVMHDWHRMLLLLLLLLLLGQELLTGLGLLALVA